VNFPMSPARLGASPLATSSYFTGATHTAASASYSDVNTALGLCSDKDILQIPDSGGAVSWAGSTLDLGTKAIMVQGAGGTSTHLTHNTDTPFINLSPGSNKYQRVTGIYFDALTNTGAERISISIGGSRNGSYNVDRMRIDHCTFNKGKWTIQTWGWVSALVDHNSFTNCDIAVGLVGEDNQAWVRSIVAGSADAMFIEDNTFTMDNNSDVSLNEQVYHCEGSRAVVRHNTFDGTARTGDDSLCIESHGNLAYYVGNNSDFRGQPIIEIYNNVMNVHHTYRFINIRGGSVLVHNNAATTISGTAPVIMMIEEESGEGTSGGFSPLRTAWPAQDQVNNCFFWGNTLNGSPLVDGTDIILFGPLSIPFIQVNRDYFLAAPASSGGYEYYTGSRQGGSQTHPTEADTGTMAFSAGTQAYYPYTSYTYPHPLQAGP
jgi:hypothetical protein